MQLTPARRPVSSLPFSRLFTYSILVLVTFVLAIPVIWLDSLLTSLKNRIRIHFRGAANSARCGPVTTIRVVTMIDFCQICPATRWCLPPSHRR